MGKSVEQTEADARAKMAEILRPGEQVAQEIRALTSFGRGGAARPWLLAVTDQRLLTCETLQPRWANGYGWGRVRDLKIRKKWYFCDVAFAVELGRGEGRKRFEFTYNVPKKHADPFLKALRTRWSARHPDQTIQQ